MPFITEEIWQNLRSRVPLEGNSTESIMVAEYPDVENARDDAQAEDEIGLVMQVIRPVRNIRAQLRIPAGQRLEAQFEAKVCKG
ncbi:MAG: hypothetical protein CM1200mP22_25670 [Dehalococcoidia bacterium]|nr:MAG: hypothetical protein CM1200mP22_25670 [Dehalococcoidia bacterium]